ncbi:hypothetical protein TNCV_2023541 [Trichonephila clavipes]|nr:hypothetical protein TNCV_2023541 [Trichonephila clavipes]
MTSIRISCLKFALKYLAGMCPFRMIVGSRGQGMVLPQEDPISGGHTIEREDRRIQCTAVAHRNASEAEFLSAVVVPE